VNCRLINFCWFWFKWGLIACVVGAALLVPYFYHRMDEEIRCRVQKLIADQYPGLQIKIHSAVLMKGEGITVRDLSIIDPTAEGPGAELLSYDECFIACSTNLSDLLSGQIEPQRVVIRRPTLRMTRRPDGGWSSARLLPLPRFCDGPPPEVRFENGTIEIFDPTKPVACATTLRDVNLTLTPVAPPAGRAETTRRLRIQGTATGDYFRQVSLDGEVNPDLPALNLAGRIEGVDISPEMRNVLPDGCECKLSVLGSLRGQTEASFKVNYDRASPQPWTFDIAGELSRGRLDDQRLPRPLTEISAKIHVNNQGFAIQGLKAHSNQAALSLNCSGGFQPSSPMLIEGEITQLPLDEQLLAVLPGNLQEEWHKLCPEGVIDARVVLRYDGRVWQPQLLIQCQNVAFTHHKLPYRWENGRGTLELKDDCLKINLLAFSENQPARIVGEIRHPGPDHTGWLTVACDELPINERLLKSLPPDVQSLARSMDLKGTIGFRFDLARDAAGRPDHKHLTLLASRCSLCYNRFPYAISNARCEVEMSDGNWWFRNLEGYNGATRITGEGTLTRPRDGRQGDGDGIAGMDGAARGGHELSLRLRADGVPLERDLHNALQPGMQEVWGMLQPSGTIDLTANIHYLDRLDQLDVTVRAEPRAETCSIEPVQFSYRMENLQGVFTYQNGRLTFERFSAWHGPVKMACNGTCSFQPNGGWQLNLDHLSVDRLRMDRELMQALPLQLKKGLGELNVTGPISMHGNMLLARGGGAPGTPGPAEPIASQWNLSLGLNRVGVDCGVRLENAFGAVDIAGWSDGTRFRMSGELGLDSLTCRDHQFTQVLGPFWIDDQQAMFGSGVAELENHALPPGKALMARRQVTAKICGGIIYGDGWTSLGPQPSYRIEGNVVDVDLRACARELAGSNRNLVGRVDGDVRLEGSGHNRTALHGDGKMRLRNANIYELPLMISLLKILSIKPPDPNAFSNSESVFHIQGEHVYFRKLDFIGDAISLTGKGEMDFQGVAHLVFTTTVGRADAGMPMLRNFFGGVSQQIMQIHVNGNVQNPEITQEVLPGVNQALKDIQENQNR
jgi:hypothetical protein